MLSHDPNKWLCNVVHENCSTCKSNCMQCQTISISHSTVSGSRFCLFHMAGLICIGYSEKFPTSIQVIWLQVDRRIIQCFLSISDVTLTVLKVNQHCVLSFLNHHWDWFCCILVQCSCKVRILMSNLNVIWHVHRWRKFIICCFYFHFHYYKLNKFRKNVWFAALQVNMYL